MTILGQDLIIAYHTYCSFTVLLVVVDLYAVSYQATMSSFSALKNLEGRFLQSLLDKIESYL